MKKVLIVIGIVVVLGIGWAVSKYNTMVTLKINVETMWQKVETQYQRRLDLIPNAVAITKGAAGFEQSTLVQVTESRSAWAKAQSGGDRGEQINALQGFDSAFSRLLVSVEAYPQLTATQEFSNLSTNLEGTENRIRVSRDNYNESVQEYNKFIARIPNNMLARIFGFTAEEFFQANEGAENAPQIEFNFAQ